MIRAIAFTVLVLGVAAVAAPSAGADPTGAKNAQVFQAVCGSTQLAVVVNGNGVFTPAHVVGSTAVFIPTAFDLTFTFTPTGGAPEVDTETSSKAGSPPNTVTCELPGALNTMTSPEGTFTLAGTVTGFFTPQG